MHQVRWQWLPITLVTIGVSMVVVIAFMSRDALGQWQFGIYAGALIALAAVIWLRRKVNREELELEHLRSEIAKAESEIKQQAVRIDKREQALAEKLVAYREWMELPSPVDLSDHSVSDDELPELVEKDHRMTELLESETKQLFEKIRNNEYSPDGKFEPTLLRDDAYELIGRVARIYQPEIEQPMLDTSIAQVMHAASRVCLHFLVVLERLPLDVKDYNISSLYGYVRRAVKAYDVYKSASPYFPYVSAAFYLGRMALGANPVTLGAWWTVSTLGKKGAEELTTRVVNRQALILLHDVVRVIGFEVASIYGGDFRHRDANWIYGAELTELISRFPLSRESLSSGLKEIGALQLRNEYDRVYLYRLLAEHKSAQPDRFRAASVLTEEERQTVASRLEKFFGAYIEPKSVKQKNRWIEGVEQRLDVKLKVVVDESIEAK